MTADSKKEISSSQRSGRPNRDLSAGLSSLGLARLQQRRKWSPHHL